MTNLHEIPTHLNVEDTALFGLSIRQLSHLIVGLAGGYGIWNQWPDLPLGLRFAPAGVWLLTAITFALLRPHGRGIEEWAFVALHFAATPKRTVWRVPEPDPGKSDSRTAEWIELVPDLTWRKDP